MNIELSPLQESQANRVILSVGSSGVADFLRGLDSLDETYAHASYGLKITRGSNVTYGADNATKKFLGPVELSLIAAEKGIRNLIVDTRFGSEGSDLIADIDDWLDNFTPENVMKPYEKKEKERLNSAFYDDRTGDRDPEYLRVRNLLDDSAAVQGIFPPSAMTVMVTGNTDQDELALANEHAVKRGVQLIAIIGTSKKSIRAFEHDGIDPIQYSGILGGIALGANIHWVQTAAIDAPRLREELDKKHDISELVIAGTGAFTDGHPQSDHDRPVLIERTSGVDMYVEGVSVLKARDSNQAYIDHVDAMPLVA
jgi:hypothetical protein